MSEARFQLRTGRGFLIVLALILVMTGLVGFSWQVVKAAHRETLVNARYEPPPPGMVLVPAGEFWMGSDDPLADPDERPRRKVFLPAFYMDRHEVSNREYRQFDPDHEYPEGADDLPVSRVLRPDAKAYARSKGKRLPTSAQWEKAARGTNGWNYPWGNEFDPSRCNVRRGGQENCEEGEISLGEKGRSYFRGKLPVTSYPAGASPYGCLNMSGNVWEWVGDDWVDRGIWGLRNGMRRGILRGGAYGYGERQARTSYQGFEGLETTCNDVGFRCVMEATPVEK